MATVTLPYNLMAGSPENVNNLMSNLNALKDGVNTIDTAQLAAGAVTKVKLGADVYPYAMAVNSSYGGAASTNITFPSGRFSVEPVLIAKNLDNVALTVTALSSTGFTYINSGGGNATLHWIAVQMSSSAASA